jgi:hypothetical protein
MLAGIKSKSEGAGAILLWRHGEEMAVKGRGVTDENHGEIQ